MPERDPNQVEKILEKLERHREKQIGEILREIERYREQAEKEGLNFTTPTEEQLRKKLSKLSSPMIFFQSWNGSTGSPGTISYNVGIQNPDPFQNSNLFVHVFIGPANMVPDVGAALATVDTRFPRLTLPEVFGLSIAPGATEILNFSVSVPAGIDASNYLGNSFLFRADWHDIGDYLDRSVFVFEVT